MVWDTLTGAPAHVEEDQEWRIPSPGTPDGRYVLHNPPTGGSFTLSELQDGVPVTIASFPKSGFFAVPVIDMSDDHRRALISDGALMPSSSRRARVAILDLETGEWLDNVLESRTWEGRCILSPDGRQVAVPIPNGVQVWQLEPRPGAHPRFPYVNFTPQPTMNPDTGEEYPDAAMRCTEPDICIPRSYMHRVWRPGMRLLLGEDGPLSIDFSSGCYGTDWARCYAG
ncbi:hypothetical protein AURDEDRAFT_167820 [Auricularia subglabra TFB-10046 SS5]|nr:hypothetical protein AURDEDRAFT_167820 [Auricularia subglabra TFB-10046 SS5]